MTQQTDNITDILAARLKQARKNAGLKQQTVALKTNLSPTTLSAIENGKRHIDACEMFKLAALYNKPMEWFFTEHPEYEVTTPSHQHQFDWSDTTVIQCINLLSQAPQPLKTKAAQGLIGFLS